MELSKSWLESGTFWGATGGALTSLGYLIVGIKDKNWNNGGDGIMGLLAFFTAWRLRRGVGVVVTKL